MKIKVSHTCNLRGFYIVKDCCKAINVSIIRIENGVFSILIAVARKLEWRNKVKSFMLQEQNKDNEEHVLKFKLLITFPSMIQENYNANLSRALDQPT